MSRSKAPRRQTERRALAAPVARRETLKGDEVRDRLASIQIEILEAKNILYMASEASASLVPPHRFDMGYVTDAASTLLERTVGHLDGLISEMGGIPIGEEVAHGTPQ